MLNELGDISNMTGLESGKHTFFVKLLRCHRAICPVHIQMDEMEAKRIMTYMLQVVLSAIA